MNSLVLLAMLATAQTNAPTNLTVSQAVKIAERNAFAISLAQSNLEVTRQQINEAAGAMRPAFSIGGTYTRFDQASKASFGGNSFTVQPIDEKSLNAKISYIVDLSGNLLRALRASKEAFAANQETLQATANNTKETVRNDFFAVLRANAQVQVAKLSVKDNAVLVKNTKAQMAAGTAAKVDVLNAEAQLAQAQNELISAQNKLDLSKQVLNNDLGRPIETKFNAVDVPQAPILTASSSELVSKAEVQRPEVLALQHTITELHNVTKATQSGTSPTLNLSVTGTQNIGAIGFGGRLQQAVGTASLNWPIYDGGVTRAKVKIAEQNEHQAEIQLKQTKLLISLQVREAYTNYIDAGSLYAQAQTQVKAAKEALRLAILKNSQGEGIFLEVLTAESNYATAQSNLVNARYSSWAAIASLQQAYGNDNLPLKN